MEYNVDIFHYLRLYKKHAPFIIGLVVVAVLFAMVKERRRPLEYKSIATTISPESGGQGYSVEKILGVELQGTDEIIVSLLTSRRMRDDVNTHFNLNDRPGMYWNLACYRIGGGFAIAVVGNDPKLTKDVANYSIENLDKINVELQISSNKPMLKVLDPAVEGAPIPQSRGVKILGSGLIMFMIYSVGIFAADYFKKMRQG